jgi:hypothetical protein
MLPKNFEALKRKIAREFGQLAILTAYLAIFFCVLAAYSMLLMNKFNIAYFAYGTALINAVLTAKVILVGEAINVGRRFEEKALLYSALWKAFAFGLLVFVLHLLEEMLNHLIHGKSVVGAFHEIQLDALLMRTIVIICAFVPLFVFRELRRVIGGDNLRDIFLRSVQEPNRGVPYNLNLNRQRRKAALAQHPH